MGSLKDEMRGVREENKPYDNTDDGERPEGSHGTAEPDGPQINTNQESTAPQPKLHMNANSAQERDQNEKSKDQALSGGCCGKDLRDGDGETLAETTMNKSAGQDKKKGGEIKNILMPVPETPGPSDPLSPAPSGQHHVRTQVSLEVVQCRSAATSPMTPPEGGHSFFFPSSFGKSAAAGADNNDTELQVSQQVEFCSVATSPMTPKTPSDTAFPELTGRERVQRQDGVKKSEVSKGERGQQEKTTSQVETKSEISGTLKCTTSKEHSECFSSNASPGSSSNAAGQTVSQISLEDGHQQCKQQRMGSMDQDITILVTHYGNYEEEEEEKAESYCHTLETEVVKIDDNEEQRENNRDAKRGDGKENLSTETAAPDVPDISISNPPHGKTEGSSVSAGTEAKTVSNSTVKENRVELGEVPKPNVPESPAPFGCHNIRTQVSLEVVHCQSAATSPMTPPEGDQAFYFPSSLGRCAGADIETKDTELQVGPQVEFRSVATAPMTPRTPTIITFPEVRKDARTEEKIVEEEEDQKEQVVVNKAKEKVTEMKEEEAAEEDSTEAKNCTEKGEEPVQEVRWDEKGMTWEVYGAVVEVAVLGSAIQKHLEKQVKKQKPSMPPPPPLNPSAMPLSPESIQGGSGSGSGSGAGLAKGRPGKRGDRDGEMSRRRRNPFRQLMENMQQPHCCSRAHSAE
ncbi:uncharacterized protein gprin1 [Spinachia spinachia]